MIFTQLFDCIDLNKKISNLLDLPVSPGKISQGSDMDSINEQTSEEINETSEKKISNKKEKGSGKGKLPVNQLTTLPTVSFQNLIVDSNLTRTPTIFKTLQYNNSCDNESENNESTTHEAHNEVQKEDISDQQKEPKTAFVEDGDNSETTNTSEPVHWHRTLQNEELLVVVVEECNDEDPLRLNIEEDTISAATTPNAYGNHNVPLIINLISKNSNRCV